MRFVALALLLGLGLGDAAANRGHQAYQDMITRVRELERKHCLPFGREVFAVTHRVGGTRVWSYQRFTSGAWRCLSICSA
jgi:hypothetical protein